MRRTNNTKINFTISICPSWLYCVSLSTCLPSPKTIQLCLQPLGCMSVVVDAHQNWIGQLQSGCPVTATEMFSAISDHDSWKASVANCFDRPRVNLFCGDASCVGAGEGLCVGFDVLSISTVVRTLVNLAIVAHCSNIKTNIVSKLPDESSPTFGQWPGK